MFQRVLEGRGSTPGFNFFFLSHIPMGQQTLKKWPAEVVGLFGYFEKVRKNQGKTVL